MSQPKEHPEDRGGRWLLNGVVWLVSAIIIGVSARDGYLPGVGLGVVLAFWRAMATPEITNYLAIKINWKGRKSSIQIKDSPGSQAVAVSGDQNQILIGVDQNARDLAEKVYNPLLREAAAGDIARIFVEWERLKRKEPVWVQKVPSYLVEPFEQAKPAYDRLWELLPGSHKVLSDAGFRALEELGMRASRPGLGTVTFRILLGNAPPERIPLGALWDSGKRLREYARDYVKYPDTNYDIDVLIDGLHPVEGVDTDKACALADRIFDFLEKEPLTVEMRDIVVELRKRAGEIVSRIRSGKAPPP